MGQFSANWVIRLDAAALGQETVVDISKSVSAYLGIYKDADNYAHFESQMRAVARALIRSLFIDIFGGDALKNLDEQKLQFLGIGKLEIPEPINDLDL